MSMLAPLGIGLGQGLLFLWPALAFGIAYRVFRFPDISVEGSFLIGACLYVVCLESGLGPVPALAVAAVGGAGVGALTAFLHVRWHVNKFLSGILVTAVCFTVALRVLGRSNVSLVGEPSLFVKMRWMNELLKIDVIDLGAMILAGGVAIFGVVVGLLALNTRAGLCLRVGALGGAPARNLGLSQSRNLVVGLAVTGALSGFGGSLVAMRQGFFDISMNQGVLILSLAALTLGEQTMRIPSLSHVGRVLWGALTGSVLYQIIVAYTLRLGANPVDVRLLTAIVVLVALIARHQPEDRELVDS